MSRTMARILWVALAGVVLLGGVSLTRLYDFLLFHSVAELFSVIVAGAIFMLAWNARRMMDNDYLLFIGIAYAFVAVVDVLHTLAYEGMGIFPDGSNLPTQLWIAGRYLQAGSLLIAPVFLVRKLRPAPVIGVCAVAVGGLLLSIFHPWFMPHALLFPTCYVSGEGLTTFKIVSEYVICAMLAVALLMVSASGRRFHPHVRWLIVASIGVTILSELAFTRYINAYGSMNLIGHLLKIAAFYLIYEALVVRGLTRPYSLMFLELERARQDLERTARELERSNQDLEQFAYAASHDLQEPLRMVTGYLDLLEHRYAGKLDDDAREFIGFATGGARRMRQLIQDLLTYSRVGQSEAKFADVDFGQVVAGAMESLEAAVEEDGAAIDVDPLPVVHGDRSLLGLLIQNLLSNALKFRGDEPPRVRISAEPAGDGWWRFTVSDNGIGIDPQYAERIFEIFQRLHGRDRFAGTGIGLALCKKIVRRHGGDIGVESQHGAGATFWFTLEGAAK